jgi:hypothetical protein
VRVRNFCEGFVLSPEAFFQICTDYPSFRTAVEAVAQERQSRNKQDTLAQTALAQTAPSEGGREGKDEESESDGTSFKRHHRESIEGKNRRMLACSRSPLAAQLAANRCSRASTSSPESRVSKASPGCRTTIGRTISEVGSLFNTKKPAAEVHV